MLSLASMGSTPAAFNSCSAVTPRQRGVRVARKHISWYTRGLIGSAAFRHRMNQLPDIVQQQQAVNDFFYSLAEQNEHLDFLQTENDSQEDNEGLAA